MQLENGRMIQKDYKHYDRNIFTYKKTVANKLFVTVFLQNIYQPMK